MAEVLNDNKQKGRQPILPSYQYKRSYISDSTPGVLNKIKGQHTYVQHIKQVGEHFRLPDTIYSYDIITLGNINSTYKVTNRNNQYELKSYLFQRVNTNVFKNPVEIMANIESVTSYLQE